MNFLKLVQKLKYFLWNTETFLCFMKVIWKIIEICKIKSSSNIPKIDLVLKALSPNIEIYKKFQKWTFGFKHVNHLKNEDEIKCMSLCGEKQCMHVQSLSMVMTQDVLSLSLSSLAKSWHAGCILEYCCWKGFPCLYLTSCTNLDEFKERWILHRYIPVPVKKLSRVSQERTNLVSQPALENTSVTNKLVGHQQVSKLTSVGDWSKPNLNDIYRWWAVAVVHVPKCSYTGGTVELLNKKCCGGCLN